MMKSGILKKNKTEDSVYNQAVLIIQGLIRQ